MAMPVLLDNHDGDFFKQLPHLHDATDRFVKRKVKDYINHLEPVFITHGMTKRYGLVMIHRHFDVEENEIVMEAIKGDHSVSVSIPWTIKDGKASPATDEAETLEEHGIQVDSSSPRYILPQTWTFSESGDLKAYEFLVSKVPMDMPPADFVSDLFQGLKAMGLESILGLRLIDNLVNQTSWETTPKGGRANVLAFGPLPQGFDAKKMFQVVFMFNKDGHGYCCCYSDSHSWSSCSSESC